MPKDAKLKFKSTLISIFNHVFSPYIHQPYNS